MALHSRTVAARAAIRGTVLATVVALPSGGPATAAPRTPSDPNAKLVTATAADTSQPRSQLAKSRALEPDATGFLANWRSTPPGSRWALVTLVWRARSSMSPRADLPRGPQNRWDGASATGIRCGSTVGHRPCRVRAKVAGVRALTYGVQLRSERLGQALFRLTLRIRQIFGQ